MIPLNENMKAKNNKFMRDFSDDAEDKAIAVGAASRVKNKKPLKRIQIFSYLFYKLLSIAYYCLFANRVRFALFFIFRVNILF